MRRVGTGGTPNPGRRLPAGRERIGLVERVAEVRAAPAPETAIGSNGHADAADPPSASSVSAAEMPKGPQIPGERRRSRLLDRITGMAKE
jgi:hypothetical protein